MNWLVLGLSFFGMLVAYCTGHWRGYEKGESDHEEFLRSVEKVRKGK